MHNNYDLLAQVELSHGHDGLLSNSHNCSMYYIEDMY